MKSAITTVTAFFRSGSGIPWFIYLAVAVLIVGPIIAYSWRVMVQRVRGIEGRHWPTVPATIEDEFSIEQQSMPSRYGNQVWGYQVTLGYVYHNPEIQFGQYCCNFDSQDEALAWANSFRGCTVKVHVDPKDPAKSVLRKEDLDNAVSAAPEPK